MISDLALKQQCRAKKLDPNGHLPRLPQFVGGFEIKSKYL